MKKFPGHFEGRVLDIGSLDINGGPHLLLSAKEYVGVDVGPGKNVDLVCHGEDLELQSNYFDVAMSSECFEHNKNWLSTLHNMIRMTKSGGLVVFTCASVGREEHGTSASDGGYSAPLLTTQGTEYYQNLSRGDALSAINNSQLEDYILVHDRFHHDLLFVGIKGGSKVAQLDVLSSLRDEIKSEVRQSSRGNRNFTRFLLIFVFGDRGRGLYMKIKSFVDNLYRLSVGRVRRFFE